MTRGVYIDEASEKLSEVRSLIKRDIHREPAIRRSLLPVEPDAWMSAPVRKMARASVAAQVGPMAAVAGAVAEAVGMHLTRYSQEVVVENGGDIFIKSPYEKTVAVFAGMSPLSMKIGIKLLAPRGTGVCTSSGTVGHSISGGRADAAVCVADSAALADAAATAAANGVRNADEINGVLEETLKIKGVKGCLIIIGETLGAAGGVELKEL